MKKNFPFILTIFILFVQLPLFSQATHQLPEALVNEIDSRISGGRYLGLEIGIWDSTGMHFYGFGKTALKEGKLPDENTLFEIGSISKVFTGLLLADRVVAGKMKLDDPIEKYLPEEVDVPEKGGQKILLRHLTTHTSSLPRMPANLVPEDPTNPFADYGPEELYAFLSGHELSRDIGSKAEYSNLAVGLLGHILALESGKSYEALLEEQVCRPLKLLDTRITLSDADRARLAQASSQGLENVNWDFDCLAGAGGIRSTAADMLRFLAANSDSTCVLADAMALSHQVHGEQKLGNAEMGLGWLVLERDGRKAWIHDGATGGYRSFTGWVPAEQFGFVVLGNTTTDVNDIGTFLLGFRNSLQKMGPTLISVLQQEIDEKGFKKGMKLYKNLQKSNDQGYLFNASNLNLLATYYYQVEDYDLAQKLFSKNKSLYPDNANAYLGLGEVAEKQKQPDLAEKYYRQCLDINPGQIQAMNKLKKMGADISAYEEEVTLSEALLASYTGTYKLNSTIILEITRKGNQVFAQATGEGPFEIFPSQADEFYYKVTDAQISFNRNEQGEVESLTLHQGGRDMLWKRQ